MFVYPEFILTKLYGAEYASGALVLRILSLGFVANSYFGFRYHNIIASGDSDFLMKCSVASAGINVLLNFMLVPQFGMVGAATASAVSFASIEVLMCLQALEEAKYASIHSYVQEVEHYMCLNGCVCADSEKRASAFRSKLGMCSIRCCILFNYSARKFTGRS